MADVLAMPKRRLVDDIRAVGHGLARPGQARGQPVARIADVDDVPAARAQPFKIRALVVQPLLLDQFELLVLWRGRQRRFEVEQIQRGEVLAFQETDQVGGGKQQAVAGFLHGA